MAPVPRYGGGRQHEEETMKLIQVQDWQPAYAALLSAGLRQQDVAELAGVTRAVIGRIVAGTYASDHSPKFNGGMRVLAKLRALQVEGTLTGFSFRSLQGGTPGG